MLVHESRTLLSRLFPKNKHTYCLIYPDLIAVSNLDVSLRLNPAYDHLYSLAKHFQETHEPPYLCKFRVVYEPTFIDPFRISGEEFSPLDECVLDMIHSGFSYPRGQNSLEYFEPFIQFCEKGQVQLLLGSDITKYL
jgi:hypothetical protein